MEKYLFKTLKMSKFLDIFRILKGLNMVNTAIMVTFTVDDSAMPMQDYCGSRGAALLARPPWHLLPPHTNLHEEPYDVVRITTSNGRY